MPPSAHVALVVSIVASALGALVMCLLVARYGLTPAAHEGTAAAARRLILTRFGHAFAGVCFVATGILGLVAVTVQTRRVPAPPPEVVVQPDPAAEARVRELASEIKALAARLDQTAARVTAVDGTARRLGDDVASLGQRARQMERALATLPRRPEPPGPPAVKAPREEPVPATRREVAEEPVRLPERPVVAPAPSDSPMVAPVPVPRAPQGQPRVVPPAPRVLEPAAAPRLVPPGPGPPSPGTTRTTAPASTAPPLPAGRATAEAPAARPDGAAAAGRREELADKLREDWQTIREGFSAAGDDFKAAVRDLGRKLWR
jgi:hypothetical protein